MSENQDLLSFIERDHFKTLYPLRSVLFFARNGLEEILDFLNNEIFRKSWLKEELSEVNYQAVKRIMGPQVIKTIDLNAQSYFLMQPWVYVAKDKRHIRQTFLLDPVSQIFLYDFVYRNRRFFTKNDLNNRESFGYYFDKDKFSIPSEEYKKFTERIYDLKRNFKYMGKVDISNCFNNIYHHDVVSYIARVINQEEAEKLGKFLREINEGRSTSCMPQGLYPIKVIGSFFLSFIEHSKEIKSTNIVRFMDDIFLFSDDIETINDDIFTIQKLIGDKGLALNQEKTRVHLTEEDEDRSEIEEIKKSLLQKRRYRINWYGEIEEAHSEEDEFEAELTAEETSYLKGKLHEKDLEDEDIELILSLLSTNEQETQELVKLVLENAPHLSKNLYHNIRRNYMSLDNNLINLFESYIDNSSIQEYELFWTTKILIDFTEFNEPIFDLLLKIYKHTSATNVVKCLFLEIQSNSFGLLDLKKKIARGHAPELLISSMVGLISHEKNNRNQVYKYVGKSNSIMRVLTLIMSKQDCNAMSLLDENSLDKYTYSKNNIFKEAIDLDVSILTDPFSNPFGTDKNLLLDKLQTLINPDSNPFDIFSNTISSETSKNETVPLPSSSFINELKLD